MEDNVTGEQSDLGPYCLKYKTLEHQQTMEAEDKWLNTVSFEEKNYITVILIYVCFVKQMCKLETKLGGSKTATSCNMNKHLFLCTKQSAVKHFPVMSP